MNSIAFIVSIFILLTGGNTTTKYLSSWLQNIPSLSHQAAVSYQSAPYVAQPTIKSGATQYNAQAKSALIYDVDSAQILYEKNAEQALPMASLTKLMTAMVIMQEHSRDEIVTIPDNLPALQAADQKIGVTAGEQFRLSELIKALLIYSGNDVANSLAIWDSGSIEAFAQKMNDYASEWGLDQSHFVNPTGLDATAHQSSSKDLLALTSIMLHNKVFRDIINTQKTIITNTNGKPYSLTTTNEDLRVPYIYGVKTGLTDAAGQSLILLAQKNGHEIITVVLNSPNRFQESKNMVDYTFNNYIWK